MPTRQEATLATSFVRDAIAFRRLPWVRPLVTDCLERYDAVAPLFAGNPAEPSAWRRTIARVAPAARHRALMSRVLVAQIDGRGGPVAAGDAARSLASPDTVAVVTGQQAGVFGGPLYTVLKAVTAIQLARRAEAEYGVRAVPVFWVDSEDHDWEEIRRTDVLDREFAPLAVSLHAPPGAGVQPVGTLTLDASIGDTLAALAGILPPTEFSEAVLSALALHYRPGATVTRAFAGWIETLLGRHGLVVFDAADPAAKPAVADLFRRELETPSRTCALVQQAAALMKSLGHQPQVEPPNDGVNLFYLDEAGRRAIKQRDGHYVIGDGPERSVADLAAEAAAHPERFSPNVLLRPLAQDILFPTICYVAGPSELAYQAELGGVYKAFGVEAPLLVPRGSATLVDSASMRFLERHDVAFETLSTQDESVLNHLLERQLPPAIQRTIDDTERQMGEQAQALREAIATVDPTLTGAVDTTFERIRDTLKTLHNKIVHASKKKDETLRRQFIRARGLSFPTGSPQERVLSVAYFANRHGLDFADRLIDVLPADPSKHYLITL